MILRIAVDVKQMAKQTNKCCRCSFAATFTVASLHLWHVHVGVVVIFFFVLGSRECFYVLFPGGAVFCWALCIRNTTPHSRWVYGFVLALVAGMEVWSGCGSEVGAE